MKKLHDILLGKRKQGTKNTYIVFYHYEENGKIIYIFTYFLTRKFCKDSPQEYRKWLPTVDRQITSEDKSGGEIFVPMSFLQNYFEPCECLNLWKKNKL